MTTLHKLRESWSRQTDFIVNNWYDQYYVQWVRKNYCRHFQASNDLLRAKATRKVESIYPRGEVHDRLYELEISSLFDRIPKQGTTNE